MGPMTSGDSPKGTLWTSVLAPPQGKGPIGFGVQSSGRLMVAVSLKVIGLVGPLLCSVPSSVRLNGSPTFTVAGGRLNTQETFLMSALSQALTVGKFLWTLSLRSSSFTGGRGMASTCSSKL